MKSRIFLSLVQLIFLAVFVMHAASLIYGWELILGPWQAPMWGSWVALFVSLWLIRMAGKSKKEHR